MCRSYRNEGEIAAGAIAPGTTEEVAKSAIKTAQANADRYVNDCMINIFRRMEEISNEMSEDVIDIDHSSLALMVTANINDNISVSIENDGNLLNQFPTDHFLKPAIDGICMKPGLARQLALNIPGAGNLNAAGMVKEVGHFFGVKFKPWGAVNLVNGAAKFLGYVGLAITAYQFLKSKNAFVIPTGIPVLTERGVVGQTKSFSLRFVFCIPLHRTT